MYRIDNSTATASIPTPNPAGTQGFFTNGNPVTGAAATIVDADFLNRLQEELMFPVGEANIVASKVANNQVLKAYRRFFGGNVSTVSTSTALTLDQAGLVIVTSGSAITLTLPAAAGLGSVAGTFPFPIDIINLTGNTVTLAGAGADVIESSATLSLVAGGRIALLSNGVNTFYATSTNINAAAQPRIKLAAGGTTLNLYVSSTGNDLNNGLTVGAPKATIQACWDMLQNYDINQQSVIINLANGTYTAGLKATGLIGVSSPSSVTIQGNVATPASVLINITNGIAFQSILNGCLNVTGLTIQASGSGGNGIGLYASQMGQMTYSNVAFGACGIAQVFANNAGLITSTGSYTINGNSPSHMSANAGGTIYGGSSTVTLTGTPAFSTAFAQAVACAVVNPGGMTFSGSATGVRYSATFNGVVIANGNGSTFLPGGSAGSVATGGQYA